MLPTFAYPKFSLFSCLLLISASGGFGPSSALDEIPDDLSDWTEEGTIVVESSSGWDEKSLQIFGITKKDGVYFLYYGSGFDGCWDRHADVAHKAVGLATSTDGINFTKHPNNPVLIPHDFVNVSAHEEGIRLGRIRYYEELDKFIGYFGVEDPGGSDDCDYGQTSGCDCDISVDSYVFTASSDDGVQWTPEGAVDGAYNEEGNESYGSAFEYSDGQYYLWSHYASGGHTFHASQGSVRNDLTELGVVPELDFGWSPLETFLHDDDNTVTFIYVPNGPDYEGDELRFATCTLDDPTVVTDVRLVTDQGAHRFSAMLKDEDTGLWRWYYGFGAEGDPILLRTAPIDDSTSEVDPTVDSVPAKFSPLELSVGPNPVAEWARIAFRLPSEGNVRIAVYDMAGRVVRVLSDDIRRAGAHEFVWNADETSWARGTYIVSIEAGTLREQQRIVLQ